MRYTFHIQILGLARAAATGVSILWALYNCIGPYLLMHYTWLGRGHSLRRAATAGMLAAAAVLAAATAVVWFLTPAQYNYAEVRFSRLCSCQAQHASSNRYLDHQLALTTATHEQLSCWGEKQHAPVHNVECHVTLHGTVQAC